MVRFGNDFTEAHIELANPLSSYGASFRRVGSRRCETRSTIADGILRTLRKRILMDDTETESVSDALWAARLIEEYRKNYVDDSDGDQVDAITIARQILNGRVNS